MIGLTVLGSSMYLLIDRSFLVNELLPMVSIIIYWIESSFRNCESRTFRLYLISERFYYEVDELSSCISLMSKDILNGSMFIYS